MSLVPKQWLVGLFGPAWLRCWMRSVTTVLHADQSLHPRRCRSRFIYCIWHEHLLTPIHLFAHSRIATLISQHADGELIAHVVQRLGFAVVRGSSTRGGTAALRALLAHAKRYHLALTADGPRGPRRVLKHGVVYLAQATSMPVLAVGFGYTNAWRCRSWDRFAIPRPGSTVHVWVSQPITLTGQDLAIARQRLQVVMDVVQEQAERLAGEQQYGELEEAASRTARAA